MFIFFSLTNPLVPFFSGYKMDTGLGSMPYLLTVTLTESQLSATEENTGFPKVEDTFGLCCSTNGYLQVTFK